MKRVLIVEDEALLRDAYALILKAEGYKVDLAENGKVAITKLDSFKPNIILLDMLMPVMDGQKFLQATKPSANYPGVKIIMLSNLSDPMTSKEIKAYGIADLFIKADFSPSQLLRTVKKYSE